MDKSLTRVQEDMWQTVQPIIRELEAMRLSRAEGSADTVKHLHTSALGICATIGEITKQRRTNIIHCTKNKVDMRLLKDAVYPAGTETLFAGLLIPSYVHFLKAPMPGKGKNIYILEKTDFLGKDGMISS